MKAFFLAIFTGICILIQIFFAQSWQITQPVPNVLLALIVTACIFYSIENMLWTAFAGGLFMDIYGNGNFGINLGFYLLIVVICKYLLSLGERDYSWWKTTLVVGVAALLQAVVYSFSLIRANALSVLIQNIVVYVGLTMLVAILWYLILVQMNVLSEKMTFIKVYKKK